MAAVAEPSAKLNGLRLPRQDVNQAHDDGATEVVDYLSRLLEVVLGASRGDLVADGCLLADANLPNTIRTCSRFLNDTQPALYAQKHTTELIVSTSNGTAPLGVAFIYTLSTEPIERSSTISTLAILKRPQPINPTVPLSSQLHIVKLPGLNGLSDSSYGPHNGPASPFQLLHSVVHSALSPYFESISKLQEPSGGPRPRSDGDQRLGIPGAKKKLAELELSLLQLQQNAEIPQLSLPMHPVVVSAVEQTSVDTDKSLAAIIPRDVLSDSSFHNALQSVVNGWIKSIQTITKTSRDPSVGTASQEINFWLDMELALADIEVQLQSRGVQLTIEILKNAKRFMATFSLDADTGLRETAELVSKYNQLMRDFPIDELLSATSMAKVQLAIDQIFLHLNKKLRICPYPIKRALPLVEAISADLDSRMHALLNGRILMQSTFQDFENIMDQTNAVWRMWEESVKDFTNVARELTRRRNERYIPIKITSRHVDTQDRLKYIRSFRSGHEQLQNTISNVLQNAQSSDAPTTQETAIEALGDVDAAEEVAQAYSSLRDIDILDVSPDGTASWERAELLYNERTARVENTIIARLRDRLATAKTANEMFRVFSKFNALFIRPKIRGAIAEYQTQLIDNVKKDIALLHERFKQQYGHSQAHAMAQLHDLPPVSGAIIWARQIERQLDNYMKKVEDVLGAQWHMHAEGQKLIDESSNFRRKLDTRPIFQSWMQDVTKRNIAISGRLFNIGRNRAAANRLELSINFDAHVITLFKEVKNLLWLSFSVPHAINNASKEARRVYPYAVSLVESVRVFLQTCQAIGKISEIAHLLNGYRFNVLSLIAKGVPLKWDSFIHAYDLHKRQSAATDGDGQSLLGRNESKHLQFVRDFAAAVATLQNKTSILEAVHDTMRNSIENLKTCKYQLESFQQHVDTIQSAIDRLSLEGFANLVSWVDETNTTIEATLRARLEQALAYWMQSFELSSHSKLTLKGDLAEPRSDASNIPSLRHLIHEISIQNQMIYLDPPLEFARSSWLFQLHNWLSQVCQLPHIQSSRYEIRVQQALQSSQDATFAHILQDCAVSISHVYGLIESRLAEVQQYVQKWLQFQSLWDLQGEQVYDSLGDDLTRWLQILSDIKRTRSTFDTSETRCTFGLLSIDYEQVQVRVNAKYDTWQNDVLGRFANKLGSRVVDVFSELERSRKDLESATLEASSTAQAVAFITVVQNVRRRVGALRPELELFRQGQTVLSRQRFNFPADWIFVERVDGEWNALNEILERKAKVVNDQTDALRAKILAEDQIISKRIADALTQWSKERPNSGAIPADEASKILASFESKLSKLQTEADLVSKAKEALDLPPSPDDGLDTLLEEVIDFKSVWAALSTIWDGLGELREMLWTSVQPRKVRQSLEGLISMSRDMPSRMRQYAAFEYLQTKIKQLQKANSVLTELRSEAIRERHWLRIFKALQPQKRYSSVSLTLGDVWELKLLENEFLVRQVIAQAQGEMALEEYLKQVRETWQNYSLDLVNYQSKCRLIRGWDDLFAKCSDHLNSLQAMQHSPFYRAFEEQASSWEEKLNKIYVLFDVWIDVQRQWVYLEGVFSGNADIKHLLPMESSRFQNINSEFFAVMKKVQRSPFVLDVLAISGVQKSLERLLDLLNKIQKALGEYLERERSSFPRFYFVGDEDLLEIIGNSNDTARIGRHLAKMFAGIAGLLTEDEITITGFRSAQGEEVLLKRTISLTKTPKINEWLASLEENMKSTLAELLSEAVEQFTKVVAGDGVDIAAFSDYLDSFPAQIAVLAGQIWWTSSVEHILHASTPLLQPLIEKHVIFLRHLAQLVIGDLHAIQRKTCEHLITEFVYQRDIVERMARNSVNSPDHYLWLLQLRYIYSPEGEFINRLKLQMADAVLDYGFEYLGVVERLVRTPLTDRCFLTMTQALSQQLGGSPYGPAGTGKTETVKALGTQLGRFTLVFCCDDSFDFQAMGRIFLGICQVGAWGCFDEFNRLEERILSAVSQQIQNIQLGLKRTATEPKTEVELVGRQFRVNLKTGIFITMNPGYAGRSNLPDNLKKLFRSVAMSKPDKEIIAEVTLYSQGFNRAREISKQIVPYFDSCSRQMSKQAHYDFGLRALKSVLISSGALKRACAPMTIKQPTLRDDSEPQIIVQSLRETISPKLVQADVLLIRSIEKETFPDIEYIPASLGKLEQALKDVAQNQKLVSTDVWMAKAIQLFQIQQLHHGVMMVGASGTGKSASWRVLLQALQQVEGVEGTSYVIDPKVMSKEALYGSLDSTTREWTDGLFTTILRKIIDNLRGEQFRRHWIVFDGDVDPEWVENLNSVLDDNKLLTLPNGERLVLPPNVRILFEVESLEYATLATVSRCGMVWFNDENVTSEMLIANYIQRLQRNAFEDIESDSTNLASSQASVLATQASVAEIIEREFGKTSLIQQALQLAENLKHIMTFTRIRALESFFSLLNRACRSVLEYNSQHYEFPLELDQMHAFICKKALLALVWALAGDTSLEDRRRFGDGIAGLTTIELPGSIGSNSIIDFTVTLPEGTWSPWQSHVPNVEVNTHSITQSDVVIPTLDTVRHEDVLYAWLAEHKPLVLCGPPGSGKTMTLFSALRKLPDMEVVGLNFSSATTPDLLLKSFEQHCEYRKTLNGVVLSPSQIGRWLVIFCDEINLPAQDKYHTQRVISFMRQLVESNGFWRTSDKTWVTLDRIQFVGACNPPTDAGRVPLGLRFLRHVPLVMVDYPGRASLIQIYGTFNNAVMKVIPSLRPYATALTQAMVQLYAESQARFTPQIQPHYLYSPRELTRWVRGIYEALRPLESLEVEGLIRIWAHEALRLFQDRLIDEDERQWTIEAIHRTASEFFPTLDLDKSLAGPILFSNWLSKNYVPVDRDQLRDFVKARLRTFCEEEVDVPLVLYDDALDHVLRIDRVFRQPQGHVILIGVSGSGKTTLSRFVAWMNGLKVFQIKVHGKYSAEDFDEDLRAVLRRCGCKGEKICFVMDESNVLDSAFLERMNTLLANAEVPGLFEGDDYSSLMTACREGAQRQGLLLDTQEELYRWFTQQIARNLHVVFTMNPPEEGLSSRAATSPALFNRCVLNWFGDWSDQALFQVGTELTQSIDLDREKFLAPATVPLAYKELALPLTHREVIVNAMVYIHHSVRHFNLRLHKQQNKVTYLTPRHFLDFLQQYTKLYDEKREDLEEQQRHLNVGLEKLRETVEKVRDLRRSLASKKSQLEGKDREANEKLQKMIGGQQQAEKNKTTALQIQTNLEKQEEEVAERRGVVLKDLANAEPAVMEAQKSVSNIKRQQLTEVRSMASPPAGVKLALEAVCTLLGHRADNWKAIQAIVRRDDFIASIVNYDNEKQMTPSHRMKMRSDYLSLDDFTYERVNRASKACGPLVQWVQAQVNYSEILDRVGPLREEVVRLEDQALQTKAEAQAIQNSIQDLEASIAQYKSEYAALVSETQLIKAEMSRVQQKVNRSLHLLDSLASERKRWEEGSKAFDTQIQTIVGDTLVAAAFLAYGGLYDQQFRRAMIEDWLSQLSSSGISYKADNPTTEYLSSADERLQWQDHGLPVDDLCTENAIILKKYNRYPLIIDPSGRTVDFLRQQFKDRRLTVTSFLDDSFTKQIESALRFGNPILVQDAEYLDPVLNHVLNREYQKTGGRVLIQLGKQEIDFSPSFRLFLSTRDPSALFAPDICSRTTFVNFTVTQSSLQTQTLNDVLKSERPDVDERRSNLLKMQGEFRIHLRHLERRLLQALNESKGNILDDDAVVETLETVKKEVAEITTKVAETEGVMGEVNQITSEYEIVAQSCSAIFAVLEQLRHINHFYQFSLKYFTDIFNSVLAQARSSASTSAGEDYKARVKWIIQSLFTTSFRRTSMTVLQKDRMTLAMLLAQSAPYSMNKALFDVLLDPNLHTCDTSSTPSHQEAQLRALGSYAAMKEYTQRLEASELDQLTSGDSAEKIATAHSTDSSQNIDAQLKTLVLVKSIRADRILPAAENFVSATFGRQFFDTDSDLSELVDQITPTTPIALCCSPGFDASFRVDTVVEKRGVRCVSIAMGSSEGLGSADKAIAEATAAGSWVYVKNVHLAIAWLQSLEKRLDALKPREHFRLFLSMECSLKIPVNLLRTSRVIMCEQPAGLRANMKDSFSALASKATTPPMERTRIYLLLSILHGIIQERLRYAPTLGWNAAWEFNDSDYDCAIHVADTWLNWASHDRVNIPPNKIPWEIIRALVIETYGGKIDNEVDFGRLTRMVNGLLTPSTFDERFDIAQAVSMAPPISPGNSRVDFHLPNGTAFKGFQEWIEVLPEREPPAYLGLPANAEKLVLVEQGKDMLANMAQVMDILDESEQLMANDLAQE